MRQAAAAFERRPSCDRIREIMENSGAFSCIVCRAADQVRWTVRKLRLGIAA